MTTEQQDVLDNQRPYVEVRRLGKFRYSIRIIHSVMQRGPGGDPWVRYGRLRAFRKGRKELKKYVKWLDRRSRAERIDI
jgi:hypothetical protein